MNDEHTSDHSDRTPHAGGDPEAIRVPRETVNDDVVKVVRWLVADGADVRPGLPVVEVETSKSVIDVEPPVAGRLRIVAAAGASVPVGGVLGTVAAEHGAVAPPSSAPASPAAARAAAAATSAGGSSAISAKAQSLIEAHGIDLAVFAGLPLVREADVLAHLAAREPAASPPSPVGGGQGEAARPPAAPAAWRPRGLFGDAARSSADRGVSVVSLVWNYLWRNWLLGNLVRVAPRGVINVLHRLRGVRIGSDCFIDPAAILETAYPENITLGDDVRVTAGAIVMTHIKPPHYLRDRGHVPVVIAKVVLEDHCFIGVNAVVMPGVTVGRAAVVASGAVVVADVPPLTMVAGNPAKVVKRFVE
jgi:acetyltransferase-like isoleucine patch superfamily enzyme